MGQVVWVTVLAVLAMLVVRTGLTSGNPMPALRVSVRRVLRRCPKEEVLRVTALRYITGVADLHPLRNGPTPQPVCRNVRTYADSYVSTGLDAPVLLTCLGVYPALTRLVQPGKEPVFQWSCYVRHQTGHAPEAHSSS